MPEEIAGTGADIVALQEVWNSQLRAELIRRMDQLGYPYVAFKAVKPEAELLRGKSRVSVGSISITRIWAQ